MKRYTLTILTTASALILATNIASAESPVYGGFTSSNGVTLPALSPNAADHSDNGTARAASERVYGAFHNDRGITLPDTREQPRSGTHGHGAIATRMPDVRFGRFVTIDGVTAPLLNAGPARAPTQAPKPATTVAAR